jgi:hypothetical protein
VVKDLEALGFIEESESEPFQVKDEDGAAIAEADADATEATEPDVIVVKGEVVKDTDPDAWI